MIVIKVVLPLLSVAEQAFGKALDQINLDDLVRYAERSNGTGRESGVGVGRVKQRRCDVRSDRQGSVRVRLAD